MTRSDSVELAEMLKSTNETMMRPSVDLVGLWERIERGGSRIMYVVRKSLNQDEKRV